MAEKRMFSLQIVDTDVFLEMPLSSQALYFHLSMRADDDGFVDNPNKITRMINASKNDYDLLLVKKFIIPFDNGICVIKHWRINNYIQKDRYKPTTYTEEKQLLEVKDNGSYKLKKTMDTVCIQDVSSLDTQIRLDKISIDKSSNISSSKPDGKADISNLEIVKKVVEYLNSVLNTSYRYQSKEIQKFINARIATGFTYQDFLTVIDKKVTAWKSTEYAKFLRPETLFGSKFESYLNEISAKKQSDFIQQPKPTKEQLKGVFLDLENDNADL